MRIAFSLPLLAGAAALLGGAATYLAVDKAMKKKPAKPLTAVPVSTTSASVDEIGATSAIAETEMETKAGDEESKI